MTFRLGPVACYFNREASDVGPVEQLFQSSTLHQARGIFRTLSYPVHTNELSI